MITAYAFIFRSTDDEEYHKFRQDFDILFDSLENQDGIVIETTKQSKEHNQCKIILEIPEELVPKCKEFISRYQGTEVKLPFPGDTEIIAGKL